MSFNLGAATGTIQIGFDPSGVNAAVAGLDKLGVVSQGLDQKLQTVGGALAKLGAGIGLPLVGAVKVAADFEQQLANIASVGGKDAAAAMEQIRSVALQLGKDTAFSASEAAAGMEEMIKASLPVADVLNGAAAAALNLSAATGTSVPESATIMSTALNVFSEGMTGFATQGDKAIHIADLFAQAANASATDVGALGLAFSQSALVADMFGISVDDTAKSLGLLANAGLQGSDAGTSLKTMLLSLTAASVPTKEALNSMGLSLQDFFDQSGNFIGIPATFDKMRVAAKAFGLQQDDVTAALTQIFGRDGVRAASVFFDTTDQGWTDFATGMDNAGTAAEQAQTRLNTFDGATESLKGSVETFAIVIGTTFLPALTQGARSLAGLVNTLTSAPEGAQKFVAVFAGIAAVVLTGGGGALVAAGKFLSLTASLEKAGISAKAFMGTLGLLGLILGVGIVAYQNNFLGFADAVNGAFTTVSDAIGRFVEIFNRAFNKRQTRGLSLFGAAIGAFGRALKQITGIDITGYLNDLGHAIDAARDTFTTAIDRGLNPLVAVLLAVQSGLASLGGSHTAGPIAAIARGFGLAAAAVQKFGNIFGAVFARDQANGVNAFSAGIDAIGKAFSRVTGLDVSGPFTRFAQAVQTGIDTFRQAVDQGINPFEAALIGVRAALSSLIGLDLRGLTDVLGSIGGALRDIASAVLSGNFAAIPDILGSLASSLAEAVRGLVVDLTDWVLNVAAPSVLNLLGNVAGWLKEKLNAAGAVVEKFTAWVLNVGLPAAGAFFGNLAGWILDQLQKVTHVISGFVDWTLNVGLPALGGFVGNLSGWILEQLQKVPRVISGFVDWTLHVALPAIGDAAGDFGGWIAGKLKDALPIVNSFKDWTLHTVLPAIGDFAGDLGLWILGKLQGLVTVVGSFKDWTLNVALPALGNIAGDFGAWILGKLQGLLITLEGFKDWTLNVGLPALGAFAGDLGAWILPKLQALATTISDFTSWTLNVGLPAAGAFVGDLKTWIGDRLAETAVAIEGFTGWSLSLGPPGGGSFSAGVPGNAPGGGISANADIQAAIGDKIHSTLDALAIVASDFTGWSVKIAKPEEGGITIDGTGIMDALLAAIHDALKVDAAFVAGATELGTNLGTLLGNALSVAIDIALDSAFSPAPAFTAAGAGPGGTSTALGTTAGLSFGDAFAGFDEAFTVAFEGAVQKEIDKIAPAIKVWYDQKQTDLWNQLFNIIMGVPTKAPDPGKLPEVLVPTVAEGSELTPEAKAKMNEAGAAMGVMLAGQMQTPEFQAAVVASIDQMTPATFSAIGVAFMSKMSTAITASLAAPTGMTEGGALEGGANLGALLVGNVVTNLTDSISRIGDEVFAPLGTAFMSRLSAGLSAAIGAGSADAMNATVVTGAGGGGSGAGLAGSIIGGLIADLTSAITGGDFSAFAAGFTTQLTTAGTTALTSLGTLVATKMVDLATEFTVGFTNITTLTTNGLTTVNTAVTTGLATITAQFTAFVVTLTTDGTDAGQGFNTGLIPGLQAAAATASTFAQQLPAIFASAVAAAQAAGAAVGEGFAAGMEAAQGRISAAAQAMVDAADTALRAKAEIASPSMVFFHLGEQTGQGYADGIASLQGTIADASTALVKAGVDGASELLDGPNQLIAAFATARNDFAKFRDENALRLTDVSKEWLDNLRAGREVMNGIGGDMGAGQGFGLAAGPGMSGWDDWVSQQTREMRENLRRGRAGGTLDAQNRLDLMAGNREIEKRSRASMTNAAAVVTDRQAEREQRQADRALRIELRTELDGEVLDRRIVDTAIGGMTRVPSRGAHRNSRLSVAGV